MKTDWLKPLLLTGAVCLLGNSTTHAQVVVQGFTGVLAPENWTLSATADAPENGGYAEFDNLGGCSCGGDDFILVISGADESVADPDTFISGPVRITASILISSHVTFEFDYSALTLDSGGWGSDEEGIYDSVGYTIQRAGGGLTTVSLSPASGFNMMLGSDFFSAHPEGAPPEITFLPTERVELFAGDTFTFYVDTEDSMFGQAILQIASPFTAVPEPGEWMALAGVGMMGFAGVRRWRQNKAAIKA